LSQVEEGQAEVALVVQTNSSLREKLDELERNSRRVEESVCRLVELSTGVKERAEEIQQATYQQHLSSEQVINSARSLSTVAEQNASASQEIAASSIQLEKLTYQLNGVLSKVRL